MDKAKTWFAVIGVALLAAGITYFAMRAFSESKIEYVRERAQQRIDSISVVKQAAVAHRSAIEDSLEALDVQFADHVTRTNQRINSYTSIIGRLRLEKDRWVDSTRALRGRMALSGLLGRAFRPTPTPIDTTVRSRQTWGDSLFTTEAVASFSSDSLQLYSTLRQLRDIRLDIATTMSDDRRQVNVFVRSADFDSLNVKSVTEIQPQERRRYGWILAGILVLKEALTLIF